MYTQAYIQCTCTHKHTVHALVKWIHILSWRMHGCLSINTVILQSHHIHISKCHMRGVKCTRNIQSLKMCVFSLTTKCMSYILYILLPTRGKAVWLCSTDYGLPNSETRRRQSVVNRRQTVQIVLGCIIGLVVLMSQHTLVHRLELDHYNIDTLLACVQVVHVLVYCLSYILVIAHSGIVWFSWHCSITQITWTCIYTHCHASMYMYIHMYICIHNMCTYIHHVHTIAGGRGTCRPENQRVKYLYLWGSRLPY